MEGWPRRHRIVISENLPCGNARLFEKTDGPRDPEIKSGGGTCTAVLHTV